MANITNKPMAYITVNKGRTKIKKDKFVYLENGTEFEIELHNPTQTTVLAKISINNKLISYSGIVLRPGERVFLERYLDTPNRFKFETYTVGGNSEEVKKAIELNGLVKIDFYNEDTTPTLSNPLIVNSGTYTGPTWQTTTNPTWTLGDFTYTTSDTSRGFGGVSSSTMYCSNSAVGSTLTGSLSSTPISASASSAPAPKLRTKSLETGRVEEGSHSSQSFQTVSKKFYYYTTNVVEYHIKPVSQMLMDVKDVNKMNKYCTKCGRKSKQNDNFCAGCGNRF